MTKMRPRGKVRHAALYYCIGNEQFFVHEENISYYFSLAIVGIKLFCRCDPRGKCERSRILCTPDADLMTTSEVIVSSSQTKMCHDALRLQNHNVTSHNSTRLNSLESIPPGVSDFWFLSVEATVTYCSMYGYNPFSSNRQHLSYDDCLEVKGDNIRTVLCCIV